MLYSELFNSIIPIDPAQTDRLASLEACCREYPYAAAFHFFRLKEAGWKQHNELAATAALYLNNPFLLHSRLHEENAVYGPTNQTAMESQPEVAPISQIPVREELESPQIEPIPTLEKEADPINTPQTETVVQETELLFEPLYSTDYFASQGIKLTEEAMGNDQLGKQLRSFTGWLRTMKRVQATAANSGTPNLDVSVQQLAEKSNQEADIITESMAEAFLLQGKINKAIGVYEKLSLLNPAKSAYFAAKIVTLKEK